MPTVSYKMLLSLPLVFQIWALVESDLKIRKRSARAGRAVSYKIIVSLPWSWRFHSLFDSPAQLSRPSTQESDSPVTWIAQLTSPSWLIYYAQQQRVDSASDTRPISTAWHGQRKADVQCRRWRRKRPPLLRRFFSDQPSWLWPRRNTRSSTVPYRSETSYRHDTDEYAVFHGDVDVYRVRGPPVSFLQSASCHGAFSRLSRTFASW